MISQENRGKQISKATYFSMDWLVHPWTPPLICICCSSVLYYCSFRLLEKDLEQSSTHVLLGPLEDLLAGQSYRLIKLVVLLTIL